MGVVCGHRHASRTRDLILSLSLKTLARQGPRDESGGKGLVMSPGGGFHESL